MFTEAFDSFYCTSYKDNIFMYNIICNRLNIPYEIFDDRFLNDVWKRKYPGIGTKITINFKEELNKFPYTDQIDNKKRFLEIFNKATVSPFYIGHKTGNKDSDIVSIYFLLDEDLDY